MTKKITVSVRVTDKNSQVVKCYKLEETREGISDLHIEASKVWSEYWVNFSWDSGKSFICGVPRQMQYDEELLDMGEMSFDEFCEKWYSKVLAK